MGVSAVAAGMVLGVGWLVGGASPSASGWPPVFVLGALALAVQWIAYVPAAMRRTETFYDLVGSATYLVVTGYALFLAQGAGTLGTRGLVLSALVAVWALRLGGYLVARVRRVGKDGRFDRIKGDPWRFLMAWTLQGLWVLLTALPVLILITDLEPVPVGAWDVIGWSLWLVGFVVEVVADRQKAAFRAREPAGERWIDEGLWSCSQHPNYFGEILLWTGVFMSGLGVYQGTQWLAALSPVFVFVLLTRVSGIPPLQERGDARWGDDPAYRRYRASTPLLVPWPTSRDRGPERHAGGRAPG